MLACTLKAKAENGASSARGRPVDVVARHRRRGQVDHRVEQQAHPEVRERRSEEHGRDLTLVEALDLRVGADLVEQRQLVGGCRPRVALDLGGLLRGEHLLAGLGRATGRAGEADVLAGAPVDHAAEVAGDADRPRDRRGHDRQLRLDLVEQLERVAARSVPLVDEREQRQVALAADLEELQRLRLDALGRIEHHDRGVGGRQHPVGVLGEVAVAGGVEQVQHRVAVRELQHGRGDRDASLLLHLHPVGGDAPSLAPRLDRAGALERAAVEQELLREGGLARVGVADDREGAPARGLLGRGGHRLQWSRCATTGGELARSDVGGRDADGVVDGLDEARRSEGRR